MLARHAVLLTLSADGNRSSWSYRYTGTLPRLISFVSHDGYENESSLFIQVLSFQILAHSFAFPKNSNPFFSSNYALFAKNHPGWGYPPLSRLRPSDVQTCGRSDQRSAPVDSSPCLRASVAAPSSIFRMHFQVPYPATPLFATLTKTAGCHPNNSQSGTHHHSPVSPAAIIKFFLFTLLRTLLHSSKTQLSSFQSLPHSLPKTTRGGVSPPAILLCVPPRPALAPTRSERRRLPRLARGVILFPSSAHHWIS
jgi:hypothetical protein